MMNNRQLADTFTLIADLLEIKGEIIYKTLAYRKAAESLTSLGRDASEFWKEGKLKDIPGVGQAIADKIDELLSTGQLEFLNKLEAEVQLPDNQQRQEHEHEELKNDADLLFHVAGAVVGWETADWKRGRTERSARPRGLQCSTRSIRPQSNFESGTSTGFSSVALPAWTLTSYCFSR